MSNKTLKDTCVDTGCRYSETCLSCKLPACVEDGYHPGLDMSKVKFKTTKWSEKEDSELRRLMKTPDAFSYQTLSNIFKRSIQDISKRIDDLNIDVFAD